MTSPATLPRLILASGSPRRRDLLNDLGFEFEVRPVDIDESPLPSEKPVTYVMRLAREKALAQAEAGELVIAADTIVAEGGELLGKPADSDDAKRMLRRLSGKAHEVHTGVALVDEAKTLRLTFVESTQVFFKTLEEPEIDWYVSTGEPLDKAGAYAVQGVGSLFVDKLEGNYANVVGLPVAALYRLLRQAGYAFPNLPDLSPQD